MPGRERRGRARRLTAALASPFTSRRRFEELHGHVSNQTEIVQLGLHHVDERIAEVRFGLNHLERRLDGLEGGFIERQRLREGLFHDTETLSELSMGFERLVAASEPFEPSLALVFAVAANLPVDARVLDVGAGESRHVLALANLGLRVTVVDAAGTPWVHPNVHEVRVSLADGLEASGPFAAAFCTNLGADARATLDRAIRSVPLDGEVVASAHISESTEWLVETLVPDSKMLERRVFVRRGPGVWHPQIGPSEALVGYERVAALRLIRSRDNSA